MRFLWVRIMRRQVYVKNSVFIVEDDEAILNFYFHLLELNDWKILAISKNGIDALGIYQGLSRHPEVVIMDINLPGCCGIELAKKILDMNSFQRKDEMGEEWEQGWNMQIGAPHIMY